jgi:hypothetical protein
VLVEKLIASGNVDDGPVRLRVSNEAWKILVVPIVRRGIPPRSMLCCPSVAIGEMPAKSPGEYSIQGEDFLTDSAGFLQSSHAPMSEGQKN